MGVGKRRNLRRRPAAKSELERRQEILDGALDEGKGKVLYEQYPLFVQHFIEQLPKALWDTNLNEMLEPERLLQDLFFLRGGPFLPFGLLAGSIVPWTTFRGNDGSREADRALCVWVCQELLPHLARQAPDMKLDSPEVEELARAYERAGRRSSKFRIPEQDDALLRMIRSKDFVKGYQPVLLTPVGAPSSGPKAERELRIKAAEEIILLNRFAASARAYLKLQEVVRKPDPDRGFLSPFLQGTARLIETVSAVRNLGLDIRLHRESRLRNALRDPRDTRGDLALRAFMIRMLKLMGVHEVSEGEEVSKGKGNLWTNRFYDDVYALTALFLDPHLLSKSRKEQIKERNAIERWWRLHARRS